MSKKNKDRLSLYKLNSVIPISAVIAVLGSFFAIFSVIYILIVSYCNDINMRIILIIIEGVVAFVAMIVTLFIIAIKKQRKQATEKFNSCQACVKSKVQDGFHRSGLLNLSELLEIEEELMEDSCPQMCDVLIYTSDLATEMDAHDVAEKNIKAGVNYRVIYFNNTCDPAVTAEIISVYGESNLVDLSAKPEYKETFDNELASALGFDIMIYKSSNGNKRGFFAVDFVTFDEFGKCPFRPKHSIDCSEQCNCGTHSQPFYKEMSVDRTSELYKEILSFFGGANGN